jgi:hypothetical protein
MTYLIETDKPNIFEVVGVSEADLEKLGELVQECHGFELDDETWSNPIYFWVTKHPTEVEELLNVDAEQKLAYRRAKTETEAIAAKAESVRIEQAQLDYKQWQEETLVGLVETTAELPVKLEDWKYMLSTDRAVGWIGTGDAWYQATVFGKTVYKVSYGNACKFYASQEIVDQAILQKWNEWSATYGDIKEARQVLFEAGPYGWHCYGSDIPKRLAELHGLDYYISIASREPWFINVETITNSLDKERWLKTAQLYHLPYILMNPVSSQEKDRLDIEYGWQDEICRHPETGVLWSYNNYSNKWELLESKPKKQKRN